MLSYGLRGCARPLVSVLISVLACASDGGVVRFSLLTSLFSSRLQLVLAVGEAAELAVLASAVHELVAEGRLEVLVGMAQLAGAMRVVTVLVLARACLAHRS